MANKHRKNKKDKYKLKPKLFLKEKSNELSSSDNQIVFTNKGIKYALSVWEKDFLLVVFLFISAIIMPIITELINMNFWNFILPVFIVGYLIWIYIDNTTIVKYIMDLPQKQLLKETTYLNKYKKIKRITKLYQIKLLGISSTISNYDENTKKYDFKYQTIIVYGNKNEILSLEERSIPKNELNNINKQLELLAKKIDCPNIIPTDGESYITIENKNPSLPIMELVKLKSTEKDIRELNSPKMYFTALIVFILTIFSFMGILSLILYIAEYLSSK